MAENERTSTGSRSRSVRLRSALDGLPQYVPGAGGTSGAVYKLSSNELPGPLAPAVAAAITDAAEEVNRYPQMYADRLTMALAAAHELSTEHVLVGNGCGGLRDVGLRYLRERGDE